MSASLEARVEALVLARCVVRAPVLAPQGQYGERNIRFGVREHAMGAICNGIALHRSGLIPYCATFFIFTDYMRNAMRMSALSEVRCAAAAGGPGCSG